MNSKINHLQTHISHFFALVNHKRKIYYLCLYKKISTKFKQHKSTYLVLRRIKKIYSLVTKWFAPHPYILKTVLGFVILGGGLVLFLGIYHAYTQPQYILTKADQRLTGVADASLMQPNHFTYNSKAKAYYLNREAIKSSLPSPNITTVGASKLSANYSLIIKHQLNKGLTVFDNKSHISFSLKPLFSASPAKIIDSHLVYPLNIKGAEAVYTVKANGLQEDIILNKPVSSISLTYKLSLPNYLVARSLPDGAVGIYSANPVLFGKISYGSPQDRLKIAEARIKSQKNYLVFVLLPPVVKSSSSLATDPSGSQAKLVLNKDLLTLSANNLRSLTYPVTVDPSVLVVSATDFQASGQSEGDISFNTNGFSEAGLTGAELASFTATTSLSSATSNATSVVYNGYVYEIGGLTATGITTATVDYAPINSNGTLGTWTATTSFPTGTYNATSVAYNGYLYYIGGYTAAGTATATVDYAPINSNGTLGTWTATTSFPTGTYNATSIVYNGYVYEIGGCNNSGCLGTTVDYAPINSNGTLGTWTATTSLPTDTYQATSVVYNGYIYEIGGYNGSAAVATVDYAPINSNGTLGSWTATTSLPAATDQATSVVYNGYIYEIGGYNGSAAVATVDYAPINSDGTLGSWTATTSLAAATDQATSVVYNGYVYEIGGYTTATNATVDYASIQPAGYTSAYTATTSLPGTKLHGTYYYAYDSTSVVYNGYVYVIGGEIDGTATATVDYAPINSNGTLGSWTATTSLPTATDQATSVVYNGYIYEVGGFTTAVTATVDYAPINSNGTLGTWTATTSLPTAIEVATSVVYNGYVYEIGGYTSAAGTTTATVDYAPINSNGTLGTWTATTSLPTATYEATSIVYNGYVYEIGGDTTIETSTTTATVDYAPINANGTLGTWTGTTSLPTATDQANSVVYNGYVYEIGGTTAVNATVDYAQINNGGIGTISTPTATTSLPTATEVATSVVYNGYVYELGGYTAAGATTATVDYAPINSNGTLGTWTATTSLPAGLHNATSIVYNGYVYEIGGYNGSAAVATVDYASINSNGTLGTWNATTSLPAATHNATSVVYNGYVYEIGGFTTATTATIDYAPINSNGTLGSWTATTSLPTAMHNATSVVYNGYVYEIGGLTAAGTTVATVDYAPINANGTLGSWAVTTSLPTATYFATSITYNGYVYEIGGYNGSTSVATVDYAPINSDGTLGSWTTTTILPAAIEVATSVVYNGYVYEIGGSTTSATTTVDYAGLQSIPRIGYYSDLINITGLDSYMTWTATSILSTNEFFATSVVYNGYIYEIGGNTGANTTTVDYAPINSNGTLGTWTATTSLPAATDQATSVVYNGYVYEIGGFTTATTATVDYAPINSNGTLGTWNATTSLPAATDQATSVVYNGYVYELGGYTAAGATIATVDYAPINSNGTLGTWTATTSLPAATGAATSVVYNGYVYEMGGYTTANTTTVDYAPINSNGTLGTWNTTTSLPTAITNATTVVYNGYVYEMGGYNGSAAVATVDYAPINTNGTLGSWTATTSLPATTYEATTVVYNGYVYEIGGSTIANGTGSTIVDYAYLEINSNVTPVKIVVNGTNIGNPGIGGLSGPGGISIAYSTTGFMCTTLNSEQAISSGISDQLAYPFPLLTTTNGCGVSTDLAQYVWIRFTLDDSQTATFPDVYSNHTTISNFSIYYHPATVNRLMGGATFMQGSLQSLDTPP